MAEFKSGLTYAQLKAIVDAGAIDGISKGSIRRNGKKLQGKLSYNVVDPNADTNGGPRKLRRYITHQFTETQAVGRGRTKKTGDSGTDHLLAEWRQQVIDDAKQVAGIGADPTHSVRDCVNAFIDAKEDIGEIRPSTSTFYRNAAKRIFRYPLATMPLIALTRPTVQGMVNDMAKTLSGKSVKSSVDVLSAVCREMLGRDASPCEGVRLPRITHNAKSKSSRPNALTFDGVARMNSLLDEREARYDGIDYVGVGARIALHTGMRAEEVCGLRWRDVDLSGKKIHVSTVIQRAEVPMRDELGNIIRNADGSPKVTYQQFDAEPKTRGSERDIPLTDGLTEILARHKRNVQKLITEMVPNRDERPSIAGLYVVGGIDGSFMSPHRLGVNWTKFARSRNLIGTEGKPVGFHDLRHTAATRMIAAGIDVATVSHLLGHAEISVTLNRYCTSDEATQRTAMERMNEVFSMREPERVDGVVPFRTGTNG